MSYAKQKKFIINVLFAGLIGLLIFLILSYGLKLASPFIFAAIFAYLLRRPAKFLNKITKIPYKLIAFFMVLLFFCTIGVLIALIGIKLFSLLVEFISTLPFHYKDQIVPALNTLFDDIEAQIARVDPTLKPFLNDLFAQFIQLVGELVSGISVKLVGFLSGIASSMPLFFIKALLMVISTFFMTLDYEILTSFLRRQVSERYQPLVEEIKNYVVGTLFVCIRSYALIMLITFTELYIGFNIINIEKPLTAAVLIAIFDILPVLGTGGIMIPWAIISLLQGNIQLAVSLLIIYLIVTVVRNILEPKIVGSQIGLHPVVTLLSLFVGAQLFGLVGLLAFPISLSLLRHLNSKGTIQLFK